MVIRNLMIAVAAVFIFASCNNKAKENTAGEAEDTQKEVDMQTKSIDDLLAQYTEFELTSNIDHLSENQKEMLKLLFKTADIMEEIFWLQMTGDKQEFLGKIEDEKYRKYAEINYGPWDWFDNDTRPFLEGYGQKPAGVNFYPHDITKEEFDAFESDLKMNHYTVLRRDDEGNLKTVWYHEEYKEYTVQAADYLKQAAELADDEGFRTYLNARAEALLTDDYYLSDSLWLMMDKNMIDFVVGPIEFYTDGMNEVKAAHESFILIKDTEWSDRLAKYSALLPELQTQLPVPEEYKKEEVGSKAQLNAYDVVYYAGDCNKASKTIAINLPNDERLHKSVGSRRLQLKNVMRAKFDKILVPIADMIIDPSQRQHVTFDAFFGNTMFHEVAHGLGVKTLINDPNTSVDAALKDYSTTLEEGKADILGLFLVTKLHEMGELGDADLMDYYVTFMASIFRSSRFGTASSHGKANMMRFDFFLEKGAFSRSEEGFYKIDFEKMKAAMDELAGKILVIQGDGDFAAAKEWTESKGVMDDMLKKDLDRINETGIPVDIYFKQGPEMLGLE